MEGSNLPQIKTWKMLKKKLQFVLIGKGQVAAIETKQHSEGLYQGVFILDVEHSNIVEEVNFYYFISGLK